MGTFVETRIHTLGFYDPCDICGYPSFVIDLSSPEMAHLLLRGARAGAATSLRLATVSNAQTGATAAARCFATDATATKVRSLITEEIFLPGMDCQVTRFLASERTDDVRLARCRLRFRPNPHPGVSSEPQRKHGSSAHASTSA